MNTQRLYSFVTTVLAEPQAFQHWRENPDLVRQLGIDPREVDWDGMRGFTALSTKVRHNQLRNEIPLTFRMLKATSLELEFFADYAHEATILKQSGKVSIADKLSSLNDFLQRWLNSDCDLSHRLVSDIIQHEFTLYQFRQYAITDSNFSCKREHCVPVNALSSKAVPRVSGLLKINNYQFNPEEVQHFGATIDLDELDQNPNNIGYWLKNSKANIKLLYLNELCNFVLTACNGRNSIRDIGKTLTTAGISIDESRLFEVFESMADQGIVSFIWKVSR